MDRTTDVTFTKGVEVVAELVHHPLVQAEGIEQLLEAGASVQYKEFIHDGSVVATATVRLRIEGADTVGTALQVLGKVGFLVGYTFPGDASSPFMDGAMVTTKGRGYEVLWEVDMQPEPLDRTYIVTKRAGAVYHGSHYPAMTQELVLQNEQSEVWTWTVNLCDAVALEQLLETDAAVLHYEVEA
jgi:hypothetical protein